MKRQHNDALRRDLRTVGCWSFLSPTTSLITSIPLTGVLKQKPSDFQVTEISYDDELASVSEKALDKSATTAPGVTYTSIDSLPPAEVSHDGRTKIEDYLTGEELASLGALNDAAQCEVVASCPNIATNSTTDSTTNSSSNEVTIVIKNSSKFARTIIISAANTSYLFLKFRVNSNNSSSSSPSTSEQLTFYNNSPAIIQNQHYLLPFITSISQLIKLQQYFLTPDFIALPTPPPPLTLTPLPTPPHPPRTKKS